MDFGNDILLRRYPSKVNHKKPYSAGISYDEDLTAYPSSTKSVKASRTLDNISNESTSSSTSSSSSKLITTSNTNNEDGGGLVSSQLDDSNLYNIFVDYKAIEKEDNRFITYIQDILTFQAIRSVFTVASTSLVFYTSSVYILELITTLSFTQAFYNLISLPSLVYGTIFIASLSMITMLLAFTSSTPKAPKPPLIALREAFSCNSPFLFLFTILTPFLLYCAAVSLYSAFNIPNFINVATHRFAQYLPTTFSSLFIRFLSILSINVDIDALSNTNTTTTAIDTLYTLRNVTPLASSSFSGSSTLVSSLSTHIKQAAQYLVHNTVYVSACLPASKNGTLLEIVPEGSIRVPNLLANRSLSFLSPSSNSNALLSFLSSIVTSTYEAYVSGSNISKSTNNTSHTFEQSIYDVSHAIPVSIDLINVFFFVSLLTISTYIVIKRIIFGQNILHFSSIRMGTSSLSMQTDASTNGVSTTSLQSRSCCHSFTNFSLFRPFGPLNTSTRASILICSTLVYIFYYLCIQLTKPVDTIIPWVVTIASAISLQNCLITIFKVIFWIANICNIRFLSYYVALAIHLVCSIISLLLDYLFIGINSVLYILFYIYNVIFAHHDIKTFNSIASNFSLDKALPLSTFSLLYLTPFYSSKQLYSSNLNNNIIQNTLGSQNDGNNSWASCIIPDIPSTTGTSTVPTVNGSLFLIPSKYTHLQSIPISSVLSVIFITGIVISFWYYASSVTHSNATEPISLNEHLIKALTMSSTGGDDTKSNSLKKHFVGECSIENHVAALAVRELAASLSMSTAVAQSAASPVGISDFITLVSQTDKTMLSRSDISDKYIHKSIFQATNYHDSNTSGNSKTSGNTNNPVANTDFETNSSSQIITTAFMTPGSACYIGKENLYFLFGPLSGISFTRKIPLLNINTSSNNINSPQGNANSSSRSCFQWFRWIRWITSSSYSHLYAYSHKNQFRALSNPSLEFCVEATRELRASASEAQADVMSSAAFATQNGLHIRKVTPGREISRLWKYNYGLSTSSKSFLQKSMHFITSFFGLFGNTHEPLVDIDATVSMNPLAKRTVVSMPPWKVAQIALQSRFIDNLSKRIYTYLYSLNTFNIDMQTAAKKREDRRRNISQNMKRERHHAVQTTTHSSNAPISSTPSNPGDDYYTQFQSQYGAYRPLERFGPTFEFKLSKLPYIPIKCAKIALFCVLYVAYKSTNCFTKYFGWLWKRTAQQQSQVIFTDTRVVCDAIYALAELVVLAKNIIPYDVTNIFTNSDISNINPASITRDDITISTQNYTICPANSQCANSALASLAQLAYALKDFTEAELVLKKGQTRSSHKTAHSIILQKQVVQVASTVETAIARIMKVYGDSLQDYTFAPLEAEVLQAYLPYNQDQE